MNTDTEENKDGRMPVVIPLWTFWGDISRPQTVSDHDQGNRASDSYDAPLSGAFHEQEMARIGVWSESLKGRASLEVPVRRRSPAQHAPSLRTAVLLFTAAMMMCALILTCLARNGTGSGHIAASARASKLGAPWMRRQTSMLFDDDSDDFGGGSTGDDGGSSFADGSGGGGGLSSADDIEDSRSYLGYLAWSDEKLQRILNSTQLHFNTIARQWNTTFSPADMRGMHHEISVLRNAFSHTNGYLIEDAKKRLQSLRAFTQQSVRNMEEHIGAMAPTLHRMLARVVNQTHTLVARDARMDARQGRRIIALELDSLKTKERVEAHVEDAHKMLALLHQREAKVTSELMASAIAFGRAAAQDMHNASVKKSLAALSHKFSLRKMAASTVKEEDTLESKVLAEQRRLAAMAAKDENLIALGNASASQLESAEEQRFQRLSSEDAGDEAKEARLVRALRAKASALAEEEEAAVEGVAQLTARAQVVGQALVGEDDPCSTNRLKVREWKTLLEELQGKLQGIEGRYANQTRAYDEALQVERYNKARELDLRWKVEMYEKVVAEQQHKLRMAIQEEELLADKCAQQSAELEGRQLQLRAEKRLLQNIAKLLSEAKLSEAKGEATALMTAFFSKHGRQGVSGGSGGAGGGRGASEGGRRALSAVATGLAVNNPQEMSRVSRLLKDMMAQVDVDAALLAQEKRGLEDKLSVQEASVALLQELVHNASDKVASSSRLAEERHDARPALAQAVVDTQAALISARGKDSREVYMLKDNVRRVTRQLAKEEANLGKCYAVLGRGLRPSIVGAAATRKDWHAVEELTGLRPVMPDHDPAMLAAVEKMEAQAVHDLRMHADISTILPPLPRSAAAAAAAEVSGSEHAALVSQRGSAGSMQGKSSVTQADEKEWHAWAFGTPMAPKERKKGWRERVGEVEKSAGRRPEGGPNDGTERQERAAARDLWRKALKIAQKGRKKGGAVVSAKIVGSGVGRTTYEAKRPSYVLLHTPHADGHVTMRSENGQQDEVHIVHEDVLKGGAEGDFNEVGGGGVSRSEGEAWADGAQDKEDRGVTSTPLSSQYSYPHLGSSNNVQEDGTNKRPSKGTWSTKWGSLSERSAKQGWHPRNALGEVGGGGGRGREYAAAQPAISTLQGQVGANTFGTASDVYADDDYF